MASLCGRFVEAVGQYDTRTGGPHDFLDQLPSLVTPGELRRLTASARYNLPWEVFSAQGWRSHVQVTGIVEAQTVGQPAVIVVESMLRITTDSGSAPLPKEWKLWLTRTPSGWLVDRATGPLL